MEMYFFGCWDSAGHYYWDKNKGHISDTYAKNLGIPLPKQIDGSNLFLPYPESKNKGYITYLPALDITIVAWWNNPWDSRPGVNNAIVVFGKYGIYDIWGEFEKKFSELSKQLKRPDLINI